MLRAALNPGYRELDAEVRNAVICVVVDIVLTVLAALTVPPALTVLSSQQ